eukprot:snap_masked-scaffold_9-processed-gene-0.13-mRNA-1 protein AED:1.00 eAED:1.00 QI:0/-1/0/0/-1/1/1/0/190
MQKKRASMGSSPGRPPKTPRLGGKKTKLKSLHTKQVRNYFKDHIHALGVLDVYLGMKLQEYPHLQAVFSEPVVQPSLTLNVKPSLQHSILTYNNKFTPQERLKDLNVLPRFQTSGRRFIAPKITPSAVVLERVKKHCREVNKSSDGKPKQNIEVDPIIDGEVGRTKLETLEFLEQQKLFLEELVENCEEE